MVYERKVLRRIFGPTKENDGTWRIKTNDELDELIRHKNIINHIKAKRLSWFGHLHQMPEKIMVKRVYKWKPMLTRSLGRPKNRWEDDKINDTKKLKIKNSTSCIQDRNKWKLYVEKAKTCKEEKEEEEEENFGLRVNHVKLLISLCVHNSFLCFLNFGRGSGCLRQPTTLGVSLKCYVSLLLLTCKFIHLQQFISLRAMYVIPLLTATQTYN
jgi:hypothetical protein